MQKEDNLTFEILHDCNLGIEHMKGVEIIVLFVTINNSISYIIYLVKYL